MEDFDFSELLRVLGRIAEALEQGNVGLDRIAESLDRGSVTIENGQLVAATKPMKSEEVA
jgi:exonuclease VII small subunit